jgi:hypothetical protein
MSNPEKPKNNSIFSEEQKTEFIEKGFERAQQDAREKELKVGQLVCHPSDDCVYELKSVENGVATVWIPAGAAGNAEDIIKQFPYAELIDPKVAYRESKKAATESAISSVFKPEDNN